MKRKELKYINKLFFNENRGCFSLVVYFILLITFVMFRVYLGKLHMIAVIINIHKHNY